MPRVSHVQEETIISDRVHCVQCITQSRSDGRPNPLAPLARARARTFLAVVSTRPAAKDHLPRLITCNHAPPLSSKRDENRGGWFAPKKHTSSADKIRFENLFEKILATGKKLRKDRKYNLHIYKGGFFFSQYKGGELEKLNYFY